MKRRKVLIVCLIIIMTLTFIENVNAFHGEEEKTIYLTFDDGPSEVTKEILDVLNEFGVKGTFFIIGSKALEYDYLIRRMNEQGHVIANHSYTHDENKVYSSEVTLMNEIYKTDKVIKYIVPNYSKKIFRFPYGSFKHKSMHKIVEDMGYSHYNWHLDAGDSGDYIPKADQIVQNVLRDLKYTKSVVLFHDSTGRKTTPEALRILIGELIKRGYALKPLDEKTMKSF